MSPAAERQDQGTPINGSRVLLCGASGGIGGALARELSGRGAHITLAGRHRDRLDAQAAFGEPIVVDLTQPEDCQRAVRAALGPEGNLDLLINAAGVVAFGPAAEMSPAVMRQVLEINTLAPMMLAAAALAHMPRGATMVNLSGVVAEPGRASASMSLYAASKAAVRAFDESLARELRRSGIHVIDARPPHTETGLADRPVAGSAPRLPRGLDPTAVAAVICDGIEAGVRELPSEAFA